VLEGITEGVSVLTEMRSGLVKYTCPRVWLNCSLLVTKPMDTAVLGKLNAFV